MRTSFLCAKWLLCVVETPADVLAIESSGAFQGTYYVLLGRLSPLDGIGPDQLGLDALEKYLGESSVEEIILATSATVEGDITAQFVADIARKFDINTSRLARGIPLGGELEYVDSGTLSRALSECASSSPARVASCPRRCTARTTTSSMPRGGVSR